MSAARISFESVEVLWRVLSERRWEFLKAVASVGALSIRAIARRVGRDVKAVHADVRAVLKEGVISKTSAGRMSFQYDGIHVVYVLEATAQNSSES